MTYAAGILIGMVMAMLAAAVVLLYWLLWLATSSLRIALMPFRALGKRQAGGNKA